jgi:hypothetical protein
MDSMRAVLKDAFQGSGMQKSGIVRVHERLPIDDIHRLFSAERRRSRSRLSSWSRSFPIPAKPCATAHARSDAQSTLPLQNAVSMSDTVNYMVKGLPK